MTAFAAFTFLLGAVVGIRFRVLVLLPLIALFGALAVVFQIAQDASLTAILLGALAVSLSLQMGYLFGMVIRGFTTYRSKQGAGAPASRSVLNHRA